MVGFPHSEILGSKLIRSSPRLIAAYYVLHRLHAPRHPLDALKALDRSHYRCPQLASAALVIRPACHRTRTKFRHASRHGCFDRSDQINQNSRAVSVSPRGAGQTSSKASLYDVERSGRRSHPKDGVTAKLALCVRRIVLSDLGSGGAETGSNRRPEACKATALPTELRPHLSIQKNGGPGKLELRPHAYQACALTT